MSTKKIVGAAAFTAALAAGGVAGALFGTPALSGAQEDGTTTTEETAPDPGAGPRRGMKMGGAHADLSVAAEALGMTAEELRTELAAGTSIADVAAEKGVDKQKVIDALVAAATARIDEMKSELPARIAEAVERDGFGVRGPRGPGGGPGGPGEHRRHHPGAFNSIDDAATALGVSRLELREALQSGTSIAQLAEQKGVSLDAVKAAMIRDATARIDQAVENGRITAEKAAEVKAALAEKIDAMVTRTDWPTKGPRMAPEPEADNASATTA